MKSEVRALEQAVCILLAKLDLLFTAELGLKLFEVDQGVHIGMPDQLQGDDAFVDIHPTRWPKKSYIHARFYRSGRGWVLYEGGEIRADHLSIPVNCLCFKPANNIMGLTLEPFMHGGKEFLTCGYERLIASLQKDVQKLKQ